MWREYSKNQGGPIHQAGPQAFARLNDCLGANWTVVVDTGAPAFPWFLTETTIFIVLSTTLQKSADVVRLAR
jgi:hypothetical protein